MDKFRKTILAMALCSLPFYSLSASANNPLSVETQRLKHQEAVLSSDEALQRADQFLSSKSAPVFTPSEVKIDKNLPTIQKISIQLLDFPANIDLYDVAQTYQGRNITSSQIFEISRAITDKLYRAGYVTSAVGLQSRDLSDGHLQFVVYWGEVDRYLVNRQLPESFKDKAMLSVLPAFKQNVFNVHHLDQLIEMMTTSNKSVTIDVLPSEKEGKSDLNFVVSRDKFPKLQLGWNNSGAENNENGRNQATLGLRMGDIIGINDEWNFSMGYRFYRKHRQNEQINYSIGYTQPFSFYTLESKWSQSNYEKLLVGQNGEYSSSGKTNTTNIKLSRMMYRDKQSILSLYGELEFKQKSNFIASKKVLNRRENKFGIGVSYITHLWNGKLYSDLSYSNGLRWAGADALAYNRNGNKTLRLISGNITWNKGFNVVNRLANYQARIGAQYSPYKLFADNQFSLGDEYTVRGFKGGIISGESGAYLSQTVSLPFYPQKYAISQITPFIGLDIGRVYQKAEQKSEIISGFAAGLKTTLANRFNLSFSYARPLKDVKHNKQNEVYYASGSISF